MASSARRASTSCPAAPTRTWSACPPRTRPLPPRARSVSSPGTRRRASSPRSSTARSPTARARACRSSARRSRKPRSTWSTPGSTPGRRAPAGSRQAPYYIDLYAPGIARLLRAGTYIGLNAHYANNFDVPIQMKVWTNVYPYPGTPEHIALTITDFNDMFTISVPPFTQKVQPGRFTNDGSTPMYVLSLGGHMHKRGLRFTAWWSDGAKAYENFDWSHPVSRPFEPPVVLAPGDHIDFECLHDNGVTRPVKRDGSGNPTTLTFGLTTDDEMCVLVGTYY